MLCQELRGPIITSVPTVGPRTDLPRELGAVLHTMERLREHSFRLEPDEVVRRVREIGASMLVISNPNNPTGAVFTLDQIVHLAARLNDLHTLVIDESFSDFSGVESAACYAAGSRNVVIVKSIGKGGCRTFAGRASYNRDCHTGTSTVLRRSFCGTSLATRTSTR
jgi:threonine-phosphate decarboxylase